MHLIHHLKNLLLIYLKERKPQGKHEKILQVIIGCAEPLIYVFRLEELLFGWDT